MNIINALLRRGSARVGQPDTRQQHMQEMLDLNNTMRGASVRRVGDYITETGPALEGAGRVRVRK